MARLSELPLVPATVLTGDEVVPLVSAGTTGAARVEDLVAPAIAASESLVGPTHESEEAGLAGTTEGQGFAVNNGDGTVTIYRKVAGSAVEQRTLATSSALSSAQGAARIGHSHSLAPAIIGNLGDALDFTNPASFFGIKSDGLTSDTVKIRDAIAAIKNNSRHQGGILQLKPGSQTITDDEIVIEEDVCLDLAGGELLPQLSGGNVSGVCPKSRSTVRNGGIIVTSTGLPGEQAGAHAPVRVGPPASDAGTIADPSALLGSHGWRIQNLYLKSDKLVFTGQYPSGIGAPAIQVYGDASGGLIDNIFIPDSDRMFAYVMADWIPTDGIVSQDSLMDTNKAAYQNGTAKTWHPRDLIIQRIFGGALSRQANNLGDGSFGIRLSGCSDVLVKHVRGKSVTTAFALVTAGDVAFEYADPAIRARGMGLIRFEDIVASDAMLGNDLTAIAEGGGVGWLGYFDGLGDNVKRAIENFAYVPLADPQVAGRVEVKSLAGRSDKSGLSQDGVRVHSLNGFELTGLSLTGFKRGIFVEENARNGDIAHNQLFGNLSHGLEVGHSARPENIHIHHNNIHSNGAAGILVGDSIGARVFANSLGLRGGQDPSQIWGLRVDGGAVENCEIGTVEPNIIESTSLAGVGESLFADDPSFYGQITAYRSAIVVDPGLVNIARSGLQLVPEITRRDSDGVVRSHYRASANAAPGGTPGAGTYVAGETLEVEATGVRTRCTSGGSPGTWA